MLRKKTTRNVSHSWNGEMPGRVNIEVQQVSNGTVWLRETEDGIFVEISTGGDDQSIRVPDKDIGKELVQKIIAVFKTAGEQKSSKVSNISFPGVTTVSALVLALFVITVMSLYQEYSTKQALIKIWEDYRNFASSQMSQERSGNTTNVQALERPKSTTAGAKALEDKLAYERSLEALLAKVQSNQPLDAVSAQLPTSEGACPSQTGKPSNAHKQARKLSDVGTHNALEFFKHNQKG